MLFTPMLACQAAGASLERGLMGKALMPSPQDSARALGSPRPTYTPKNHFMNNSQDHPTSPTAHETGRSMVGTPEPPRNTPPKTLTRHEG